MYTHKHTHHHTHTHTHTQMLGTSGQVFRQRWQVHKYTHTHTHTHTLTHSHTHAALAGGAGLRWLRQPFSFFTFLRKVFGALEAY